MFCTKCSAPLEPTMVFCGKCGAPAGGGGAAAATPFVVTRTGLVTFLAVLQLLSGLVWLVGGLFLLLWAAEGTAAAELGAGARLNSIAFLIVAYGVLHLVCGFGLWQLKSYGRILQIVFAVVGLIAIPFGTIVSILILIYLNKPGIKLLFAGKPGDQLTREERAQIAAVSGSQAALVIVIVLLVLAGIIAIFVILPAIAVPGLLRARMMGNEVSATSTILALQSAEVSFRASTGGPYATLACLTNPAQCNPPQAGEGLLGSSFAEASRNGYSFELSLGPGALSFAYVAVPDNFGASGSKSFCGDSNGLVCSVNASGIVLDQGMCPVTCTPLYSGGR